MHYDHFPRGAHDPDPETRTLGNCVATCPECNLFAAHHFDTPYEAKRKRLIRKNGPIEGRKRKAKIVTRKQPWPKRAMQKRVKI